MPPEDLQNIVSISLRLEEGRRQLDELEARLFVSEERFRTLVESTCDWIWETDANFVCTYSNTKIGTILGYKPEEALGKTLLDFIFTEGTGLRSEFIAARQTGLPFHQIELFCPHKTGRHSILEISGFPILLGDGTRRGWRGIARDITERREAQYERQQQQRKLEDIVKQNDAVLIVWRMDADRWPVEFISENAANLFGYASDDFLSGRVSWPDITHRDDNPRLEKEVAEHLARGDRKWSQEYRLITKSGEIRWFHDNNVVFTDSASGIIKIQAVVYDITEHKKLEEERKLLSNQIMEAQERAAKKFAGAIHDIAGSMLVGLSSSLLIVEEELKHGNTNRAIGKVCQTKNLVKELVEMMKNVSADIWPPNLEIAGLSGALSALFSQTDTYSKIKISRVINLPDSWEKKHKRAGIVVYRLVQEALSNAIKYSRAKNLEVAINHDNDTVRLSVSDDGCGFETNKAAIGESSLGLEIMKEQVESISGTLLIASKPGSGTVIKAEFPLGGDNPVVLRLTGTRL